MPDSTPIQIKLPPTGEFPPVQGANFFHFSFSGSDFEMLVGFVDINDILQRNVSESAAPVGATGAVGPSDLTPIQPKISARYLMSEQGFQVLRQQIEEINRMAESFRKPPTAGLA